MAHLWRTFDITADDVASAGDPSITAEEWLRLAEMEDDGLDLLLSAHHPAVSRADVSNEDDKQIYRYVQHYLHPIRLNAITYLPLNHAAQAAEIFAVQMSSKHALGSALASNPHLTPDHAALLYDMTKASDDLGICRALAGNVSTSAVLLTQMAADERFEVRRIVWEAQRHDVRYGAPVSAHEMLLEEFG